MNNDENEDKEKFGFERNFVYHLFKKCNRIRRFLLQDYFLM